MDYLDVIERESERFAAALVSECSTARVPACPDWTGADLAYHLAEVQDFWAQVASGAGEQEAVQLERPATEPELIAAVRASAQRLLTALRARSPEDPAWSWSAKGGTVAWVLRRQAHEVLMHRVDAEQTVGLPVTDPGPELARDGVDELFTVNVDAAPAWGTVTPDGRRVRVVAQDAGGAADDAAPTAWTLAFGRFVGTGPESGTAFEWDAAQLLPDDAGPVDAEVRGTAWALDRWLWGRGEAAALTVTGDAGLVPHLRAVVAEATQ